MDRTFTSWTDERARVTNKHVTVGRGPEALTGAGFWLWLSVVAALVAMAGSVVSLSVHGIYAGLTPVFLPQALAQDLANLAVASPALLILAAFALRGSLRSYLVWLGVLTFTVYNYVIYTFSIPFGPLFLLWVAVLGMCLFALVGGVTTVDHEQIAGSFANRRAVVVVAWSLIVIALLFGLLWLSEDVPALLAGTVPQSVRDMALPTNPVHVLDLAFFLPAVVITGAQLLRRRSFAFTVAPAFLVFLILTGVPILLTPVVQAARGEVAAWSVFVPIGTLTAILIGLLAWLLTSIHAGASHSEPPSNKRIERTVKASD